MYVPCKYIPTSYDLMIYRVQKFKVKFIILIIFMYIFQINVLGRCRQAKNKAHVQVCALSIQYIYNLVCVHSTWFIVSSQVFCVLRRYLNNTSGWCNCKHTTQSSTPHLALDYRKIGQLQMKQHLAMLLVGNNLESIRCKSNQVSSKERY